MQLADDADSGTTEMWIGLTTEVSTNDDGGKSVQARWIDGMYDAYTHFAYGTKLAENQCFKISSEGEKGEWVPTLNCDQKLPFVCKMELKDALVDWDEDDPRGAVIPCSWPWETYGHHCYLPMKDKEMVTVSLLSLQITLHLANVGKC